MKQFVKGNPNRLGDVYKFLGCSENDIPDGDIHTPEDVVVKTTLMSVHNLLYVNENGQIRMHPDNKREELIEQGFTEYIIPYDYLTDKDINKLTEDRKNVKDGFYFIISDKKDMEDVIYFIFALHYVNDILMNTKIYSKTIDYDDFKNGDFICIKDGKMEIVRDIDGKNELIRNSTELTMTGSYCGLKKLRYADYDSKFFIKGKTGYSEQILRKMCQLGGLVDYSEIPDCCDGSYCYLSSRNKVLVTTDENIKSAVENNCKEYIMNY